MCKVKSCMITRALLTCFSVVEEICGVWHHIGLLSLLDVGSGYHCLYNCLFLLWAKLQGFSFPLGWGVCGEGARMSPLWICALVEIQVHLAGYRLSAFIEAPMRRPHPKPFITAWFRKPNSCDYWHAPSSMIAALSEMKSCC